MEAEAIILADPYTYKFLKSLTHSALVQSDKSGSQENLLIAYHLCELLY